MTALTAVASSVASSYCSKARTLKFRGGAQSPKGTGAWCKISLPPSRTQPELSLGWLNLSGHLNLITANESTSTPSLPLHRQAVRKSKTPPGARRLRLTNVGTLHIEVSSVSTLARFLSKRLIASQLEERQQRLGHGETARVSRERKRPSPVQREVTAWLLTFSAQEIFSATWLFPLSAVLLPLAATFLRVQLASAHKVGPCSALTMRA
ncbi:uncharacterized protein [Dermacentor albipictus]|uniref:uncharacterized protein isoform X2 n=1 Tax=Dermacentor albipictus TaxID=60249 RepID=UPI0038FC4C7F